MTLPILFPTMSAARVYHMPVHRTPAVRRGLSQYDLLVAGAVVIALLAISWVYFAPLQAPRTPSFQNTCRNNLSNLSKALYQHQILHGKLPGYINALDRKDGSLYIDPNTGKATPVSWFVMILPEIDRHTTFKQWQEAPEPNPELRISTALYIDMLVCPADPASQRYGTPNSYAVNTGLPDAPLSATVPNTETAGGMAVPGIPRDWRSNGMFFDNFTSDPRVTSDAKRRPPAVVMRSVLCRRPLEKTLLLMENVDTGDYTLDADRDAADDWRRAETALGATWSPNVVEPDGKTLRKRPQPPTLHPNERMGQGNGTDIAFARPSSRHPGGSNVAYVGQNVQFMSDNIDYYVYAKLMTTSDTDLMLPGTRTPIAGLGEVRLTDEQINP